MKLASMFFTASAAYFGGLSQRQVQTSKRYETCFDVSYRECSMFWRFISKIIGDLQVFRLLFAPLRRSYCSRHLPSLCEWRSLMQNKNLQHSLLWMLKVKNTHRQSALFSTLHAVRFQPVGELF